jgi:hypothetical protein
VFATQPIAVAGRVYSAVDSIRVNGQLAAVAGDSFALPALPLALGANLIEVEARDALGNRFSAAVSVNYRPPAPTITLTADRTTITPGESATLHWTSTDATTCTLDQSIGAVGQEASLTVHPEVTTTYTIIAAGAGGTTDSVTVAVEDPPCRPAWPSNRAFPLGGRRR